MKYLKIALVSVGVVVFGLFLYMALNRFINRDTTVPEIKMESDLLEVSVKANEKQLKSGVTASDEKDGDLTDKIIIESITKFVEKNTAVITYTVCDSDNHVTKSKRKIRYTDHVPPRFTLNAPLVYSLSSRIELLDVIGAVDDIDGDISDKLVIVQEDVQGQSAGSYNITVQVSNSMGESATLTLPLYVENLGYTSPSLKLKKYIVYTKIGQPVDPASFVEAGQEDYKIDIETDYNSQKAGVYQVHYYLTDQENRVGHTVLSIVVEE